MTNSLRVVVYGYTASGIARLVTVQVYKSFSNVKNALWNQVAVTISRDDDGARDKDKRS